MEAPSETCTTITKSSSWASLLKENVQGPFQRNWRLPFPETPLPGRKHSFLQVTEANMNYSIEKKKECIISCKEKQEMS